MLSSERRLTPERGGQAAPWTLVERGKAVEAGVVMMSGGAAVRVPARPARILRADRVSSGTEAAPEIRMINAGLARRAL